MEGAFETGAADETTGWMKGASVKTEATVDHQKSVVGGI
jgi:hypothetical protein